MHLLEWSTSLASGVPIPDAKSTRHMRTTAIYKHYSANLTPLTEWLILNTKTRYVRTLDASGARRMQKQEILKHCSASLMLITEWSTSLASGARIPVAKSIRHSRTKEMPTHCSVGFTHMKE